MCGVIHFSGSSLPRVSREIWREFWVKISECHVVFQGLGESEDVTNLHTENEVKNGKFHTNFTLVGVGAEKKQPPPKVHTKNFVFCDSIMFRFCTLGSCPLPKRRRLRPFLWLGTPKSL